MAKKETINIGPCSVDIDVREEGFVLTFTNSHVTKTGRYTTRRVRVRMSDWSVSRITQLLGTVVSRREQHATSMRSNYRRAIEPPAQG